MGWGTALRGIAVRALGFAGYGNTGKDVDHQRADDSVAIDPPPADARTTNLKNLLGAGMTILGLATVILPSAAEASSVLIHRNCSNSLPDSAFTTGLSATAISPAATSTPDASAQT